MGGREGRERQVHTITEDAAKEVTKERVYCVDEVVLEDVLDCTNVARHNAITLKMR